MNDYWGRRFRYEYCFSALTPHQQSLTYLCDHEPIILKAIKEIRSKKKRPDNHSIYDHIMNSAASNIDKNPFKP